MGVDVAEVVDGAGAGAHQLYRHDGDIGLGPPGDYTRAMAAPRGAGTRRPRRSLDHRVQSTSVDTEVDHTSRSCTSDPWVGIGPRGRGADPSFSSARTPHSIVGFLLG